MAKLSRAESRIRRHRRVRKHIIGTSERPRLNIFRSEAEIYAQVIDDKAGHTLAAASSIDHDAAREAVLARPRPNRLVWLVSWLAERAKNKGITQVVFDRGGFRYIGRVKALADGAREAGLEF